MINKEEVKILSTKDILEQYKILNDKCEEALRRIKIRNKKKLEI